jgi:hypothetical protein
MKPLFVRLKDGQVKVFWSRLLAFSAIVLLLTAAVFEGLSLLMWHALSISALVVALVVATLIVARTMVRAVSYQKEELEMIAGSS